MSSNQHPSKGKYYSTPSAHKHDILALRRNEYYTLHEFYARAKAWYKAEIERYLLLESKATTLPEPQPHPERAPTPVAGASPIPTYRRIQPPRSAKRQQQRLNPEIIAQPTAKRHRTTVIIPKGEYVLPELKYTYYDLLSRENHVPPHGREYEKIPGISVAYFMAWVRDAVRFKMLDLLKSDSGGNKKPAEEGQEGITERKKCVLGMKKYTFRKGFESACVLEEEEGEGWMVPGSSDTLTGGDEDEDEDGDGKKVLLLGKVVQMARDHAEAHAQFQAEQEKVQTQLAEAHAQVMEEKEKAMQGVKGIMGIDVDRSREGTPAPVAEMAVSPTLGRWGGHHDGFDGAGADEVKVGKKTENKKRGRVAGTERLENKVVDAKLLGLKLAVDLCEVKDGESPEEGARILML